MSDLFGFDGPADFRGNDDETISSSVTATVAHEGPGPGAQGWSISLSASDGTTITDIGIAGTDARALHSY